MAAGTPAMGLGRIAAVVVVTAMLAGCAALVRHGAEYEQILAQARGALGLDAATPVVLTGRSSHQRLGGPPRVEGGKSRLFHTIRVSAT